MNDTIKIRSGVLEGRQQMPTLNENELGFQIDEEALYIGAKNKNVKVGDSNWETRIAQLESLVTNIITRLEALGG
jgi:hypothetical protein